MFFFVFFFFLLIYKHLEEGWYLDRVVVNVDGDAYEFQCQK